MKPCPKPKHIKVKKCSICKGPSVHKCCSWQCALKQAEKDRSRRERVSDRKKLEDLKTLSDWIAEAQREFNAFIRERDKNHTCICCDEPLGDPKFGGAYDCGHYRSVGSAPHLRFNEDNAHAQRKKCNNFGSGRAVDYRKGLIKRIGLDRVEDLENNNAPRKYTIEEVKEIKKYFKEKRKSLQAL